MTGTGLEAELRALRRRVEALEAMVYADMNGDKGHEPRLLYEGRGYVIEDVFRYMVALAGPTTMQLNNDQRVIVKIYAMDEGAD